MKRKAVNLSLIPIYLLITALFVLTIAGTAAAVTAGGADRSVLWWLIPLETAACLAFAICSTAYFNKQKKRLNGAFDKMLTAFSPEKTDALKTINDGNPTPEQLANWVAEQKALTLSSRWSAAVSKAFTENSSEIFWWINGDKSRYFFGDYWSKTYGYHKLVKNGDVRAILTAKTLAEFNGAVQMLKEGVSTSFTFMGDLQLNPQKKVRVRINAKVLDIEDTRGVIVGAMHNMDEEDFLVKELERASVKEGFLLRSCGDIIYTVELPENKLKTLTPRAAKELFGLGDMQDFDNERRPYWELIHPDYREGFVDRFFNYNHMMMMPGHLMSYQYKIKSLNGDYIWVEHQAQITSVSDGAVKSVIGRITNVNEAKTRELYRKNHPYYDGLTGAMLMPALREYFDKEADKAEFKTVLLFNINRFRFINNEHGYEFGNSVLRRLTLIIKESVENQKIHCPVGRADGNTFAILLLTDRQDAAREQIEDVFDRIKETLNIDGKLVNITLAASASSTSRDKSFTDLYIEAENLLNKCKNQNNVYTNSCIIHDDSIKETETAV